MAIARAMGLARGTLRKFAQAESFPARLPHGPAPSILDPHLPHLERRVAEARARGIGAIARFAVGLEVDGAAMRAALPEPWSSGQAEG